jgi:hypothetical protein
MYNPITTNSGIYFLCLREAEGAADGGDGGRRGDGQGYTSISKGHIFFLHFVIVGLTKNRKSVLMEYKPFLKGHIFFFHFVAVGRTKNR